MRLHGLEPGALVRLVPRGLAIVFRDCGEWTAVRTSDRSVELRAAGLPTEIAGHPRWIESVGAAALAMFALCGVTGSARLSEHRAPKRAAPWSSALAQARALACAGSRGEAARALGIDSVSLEERPRMAGPLAGIKIVDCSQIVSAPLAVMILADQGADVIKVEPPGYGDLMRIGPYYRGGLSAFFANCNRGKRCIVLDLAQEKGREILRRLVAEADVFVQNWRPGAAERLDLGWEDLRRVNPRLIYCSVSGYGPSGPYADRRVYDPIIQGITGHVAIQKNPEVPIPDLVRNIVADKSTSWTAAQAITAALFARLRGAAGGQHIQVPMIDASLFFFWPDGMMKHTLVGEAERQLPVLYDIYRIYETADGHLIYFTASESEFHGLFRALGKPEWCTDPRFATPQERSKSENRELLGAWILEEIRKWPTRELIARMAAEQVPVGPVNSIEEMLVDPQIAHNASWFEWEHPSAGKLRAPRPVARFSETPQEVRRMPPLHGEHTAEVLREAGFDDAAQARLRAEGVIP